MGQEGQVSVTLGVAFDSGRLRITVALIGVTAVLGRDAHGFDSVGLTLYRWTAPIRFTRPSRTHGEIEYNWNSDHMLLYGTISALSKAARTK